jgi:N-acetylglucosamine kinase-like BadF-type ATPase
MPLYFLGIDIGGTKSHALLADENGQVLGFGKAGPGNHEVVGFDGLAAALEVITAQALKSAGLRIHDLAGAGFGMAGYDWPSQLPPIEQAIAGMGLSCPISVVNDALIGVLAGSEQGWGVAVVGGTGCNSWGRDQQGKVGRVTGCGYLFGEFGGGGDVVARAVQAVAHEWSRRGPETALTPAFLKYTGASSVFAMLEGFAQGRYHPHSAAAPLVFEVARRGDQRAIQIMRWSGEQLGGLGISVIRQLKLQHLAFDVILVGSLFKAGPQLIEPMREVILAEAPMARLVRLSVPPVVGGVLLAMEAAGLELGSRRSLLTKTYPHHLEKAGHSLE